MNFSSNRQGLADYLRQFEHLGGIIVSERRKFIYMKPAKTAGTSILRNGLELRPELELFHNRKNRGKFMEWLGKISDEELEDYYIFSVVRNPWDRMVSLATYFGIPFARFVENFEEYLDDENLRLHSLPISLYTHIADQPYVDFVCRIECLQADMNLVFDEIGLERERLVLSNQSKHRHYSHCYRTVDIKKVEEIYRSDINSFGYMFEKAIKEPFNFDLLHWVQKYKVKFSG